MAEQQDSSERARVLATIEAAGVRFVNLEFTDVVGMAKCVTIPVEQFPDCLKQGKWFDGSALEGFARVAESDMYLFPDLSTFVVLPREVRPQSTMPASLQQPIDQFSAADLVPPFICHLPTPDPKNFDAAPPPTPL